MAYFDHNATTPVSHAAREAYLRATDEAWQNPSSPCRDSARVRNLLEEARARLGELLDCAPGRIVFNSGATEGVNAIFHHAGGGATIHLSPMEHPCVIEASGKHARGNRCFLPVDVDGILDLGAWEEILRRQPRPFLASVMAANNETGGVQPWAEIAVLCRKAAVHYHCDAAQWIGKMPAQGLGACGFITASAHKFGGVKGVGFLVVPEQTGDFRFLVGGEQERSRRAGTENYPGVAAMVAALEEAEKKTIRSWRESEIWRGEFESILLEGLPGTLVVGAGGPRLWNTSRLIMPLGDNLRWVRKLDRRGFQVSSGSACATGSDKLSPVLAALGHGEEEIRRGLRVSAGWATTREDWRNLGSAMLEVARELRDDGREGLTTVIRI